MGTRGQQSKLPQLLQGNHSLWLHQLCGALGDIAPEMGERVCCKDTVPVAVTDRPVLTWELV